MQLIAGMLRERIVADWIRRCFGPAANTKRERALRLFEEATELVQSLGVTKEDCVKLMDFVYSKPEGIPLQELSGVGICALGMAAALGTSLEAATDFELIRILNYSPEHFTHRHQVKVNAGIAAALSKTEE